jgi:hypothetical protein
VPAEAHTYGSFLFSFIGRGVCKYPPAQRRSLLTLVYTLIGASVNGASAFRIIAALLIFAVGVAYIALEAVPSISPPDNMNPEGVAIHDEDVV